MEGAVRRARAPDDVAALAAALERVARRCLDRLTQKRGRRRRTSSTLEVMPDTTTNCEAAEREPHFTVKRSLRDSRLVEMGLIR